MSNQRKMEGGVNEARAVVQKKSKDMAKKIALGAILKGADAMPGSGKVKDFFEPKYKEITDKWEKIQGDLSVNIYPEKKGISVGWKIEW